MKTISAFLLVAAVVGASAQRYQRRDDLESAPYSLIRSTDTYEERMYPAKTWVCSSAMNRRGGLFMKMFRYISGVNSQGQAIRMTRPVTTLYEPMESGDRRMTMCFYINEDFQSSPPEPTEEGVFLENRPDLTVIAMRDVSGYYNEQDWQNLAQQLKADAMANGDTDFDFSKFYRAGYDSPMVKRNRRNEVWYAKA